MDQKKKGTRGLREVATLQTLARGRQPRERHHLANRFARLENERARLERELSTWNARKAAAEGSLANVQEQIDALRPLLLDEPAGPAGRRPASHRPGARPSTEAARPKTAPVREMSLEY